MEVTHSARNYAALDGMRGYAAVLVSLTHFVGFYALGFRGLNVERATYVSVPHAVDALFLWLYLNMQSLYILLTISGFMVCRMVMRSSYRGYGHFLLARSVRIYPPLLFSLGFAVAELLGADPAHRRSRRAFRAVLHRLHPAGLHDGLPAARQDGLQRRRAATRVLDSPPGLPWQGVLFVLPPARAAHPRGLRRSRAAGRALVRSGWCRASNPAPRHLLGDGRGVGDPRFPRGGDDLFSLAAFQPLEGARFHRGRGFRTGIGLPGLSTAAPARDSPPATAFQPPPSAVRRPGLERGVKPP